MDPQRSDRSQGWMTAVTRFADAALARARDPQGTPLLVDGIEVETGRPVEWRVHGECWTLSNLASQQVFLRTLEGLSELTGRSTYRERSRELIAYGLERLRYGQLIGWGGHMAYDLAGSRIVHAPDKGPVHELKCHYPFYEGMWRVNPVETARYVAAFWEGHILDWDRLEFSRHGKPRRAQGDVWSRSYHPQPVGFVGRGLTFINAGSDLVYAAAFLGQRSGDPAPLAWAERLQSRYVAARHPKTGLGGYQFSISVLPGPNGRGDRAVQQFGEQLRDDNPTEVTLVVGRQIRTILGPSALSRLIIGETLQSAGRYLVQTAVEDLEAYARHAYDRTRNAFLPLLTNGRILDGLTIERSGYFGAAGETLTPLPADAMLAWAYARGWRQAESPLLAETASAIMRGLGGGEGSDPGWSAPAKTSDPLMIFALLEWYRATGAERWLSQAALVGDQIVAERVRNDLFVADPSCRYAKLDAVEPLALLHLAAAWDGREDAVPDYYGSTPFFGSAYDGLGHVHDNQLFYRPTGASGTGGGPWR